VGISTGDVALNLDARVVVATLETQRGRLLRGEGPGLLVMDELQMLGDPMRGVHYELAVALAPRHTQLLPSAFDPSLHDPAADPAASLRRSALHRAMFYLETSDRAAPWPPRAACEWSLAPFIGQCLSRPRDVIGTGKRKN